MSLIMDSFANSFEALDHLMGGQRNFFDLSKTGTIPELKIIALY